jgi:hypothetical protein
MNYLAMKSSKCSKPKVRNLTIKNNNKSGTLHRDAAFDSGLRPSALRATAALDAALRSSPA